MKRPPRGYELRLADHVGNLVAAGEHQRELQRAVHTDRAHVALRVARVAFGLASLLHAQHHAVVRHVLLHVYAHRHAIRVVLHALLHHALNGCALVILRWCALVILRWCVLVILRWCALLILRWCALLILRWCALVILRWCALVILRHHTLLILRRHTLLILRLRLAMHSCTLVRHVLFLHRRCTPAAWLHNGYRNGVVVV